MATASQTLADKPLFLQALGGDTAISYDGDALRDVIAAVWRSPGVLRGGNFQIAQRSAGANWSVDVAGGLAVVGDTFSAGVRYLLRSNSTLNLPLTGFNTAPAATRTHKVWLAVHDKTVAGTAYDARIVVTEDTGAGAPTPPDNPAQYHEIGSFTIGPAQSNVADAHISNRRVYADYNTATVLGLDSGFASAAAEAGSVAPQAVQAFGTVKLKGAVKRSSGSFAADTSYVVGSVPAIYRPPVTRYGVAAGQATGGTAVACRVKVEPSGSIQLSLPAGWSPAWIVLDGISYEMTE